MKKKVWMMFLTLMIAMTVLPNATLVYAEEEVEQTQSELIEEIMPAEEELDAEEEMAQEEEIAEVELVDSLEENPEDLETEEVVEADYEIFTEDRGSVETVEEEEILEEEYVEPEEVLEEENLETIIEHIATLIEEADRPQDWKDSARLVLESMYEEDLEDLEGESDEAILMMFDVLMYGDALPEATSMPYYYIDQDVLVLNGTRGQLYQGAYSVDLSTKETIKEIVIDTDIHCSEYSYYFSNFSSVSKITGLEKLNTADATSMSGMFSGCSSLLELDLSSFDTRNVTNMSFMFKGCENLSSLNLENFQTDQVVSTYNMFQDCAALSTLDLSHFNTERVKGMDYMFSGCTSLKNLKVSGWNTENVTSMYGVFEGLHELEGLDLSNWQIYTDQTALMFDDFDTFGAIVCPSIGGDKIALGFKVEDEDGNTYTDLSSGRSVHIYRLNEDQLFYDPSSNEAPVHGQAFIKGPYLYRYFRVSQTFKGWTVTFLERYRWNPCLLDEHALKQEGYLNYGSYRTSEEGARKLQESITSYLDNSEALTVAPALPASAEELHGENVISLAELFKVDERYLNTSDWSTQYGGIHALASDFSVPVTADVTNMFMNAVYIEELPSNFILPDRSDLRGLFANAVRLDPFANGLSVSDAWKTISRDLGLTFAYKGAIYATKYPHTVDNRTEYDMFYNTGILREGGLTVRDFDTGSISLYSANDGSTGGASIGFGSAQALDHVTALIGLSEFHLYLNSSVRYTLLDNANLRSIKNLTVYDTVAGNYKRTTDGAVFGYNVDLLNTPNLQEIDGLVLGGFDGSLLLSCTGALTSVKNISLIPACGNEGVEEITLESTRGLFSTTPNVQQIQIRVVKKKDTLEAISPDVTVVNPDLAYDNEQWQWYFDGAPITGATGKVLNLKEYDLEEEDVDKFYVRYVNSLLVGGAHFDENGYLPEGFILNHGSGTSDASSVQRQYGIQTFSAQIESHHSNDAFVILQAAVEKEPEVTLPEETVVKDEEKPQSTSVNKPNTEEKRVVEEPEETKQNTSTETRSIRRPYAPATGDATNPLLYSMLLLVSVLCAGVMYRRLKQKKE